MRRGSWLCGFAVLSLCTSGVAQTVDEAISELRAGSYESAIDALENLSGSSPGPDLSFSDHRRAYVAYLSGLAEIGRYEEAREVAE